ncbi:PREDICTED: uncharacterized protein C9orf50 homolog [Condylura cristata]|uniref:uncharacterized protein C9orf50 homolog n=1 Tax=Condylura cristata TaxID=143302 RepID=UPI0006430DE8|nr:PREDICTED: uncharacterized protein C9orf50 homolog [Condylura cristata]
MPRRHPKPGAQQVAPQGFPGDGDRRRRVLLLPRLTQPELRAAPGAKCSGCSRTSVGAAGWWPDSRSEWSHPELVGSCRSPQPHLPALRTVTQRAAQNPQGVKSPLLPPLLVAHAPQDPAPQRRRPELRGDPRRDSAREGPDFLGALLGELLPSRFRQFLRQLRVQSNCETPGNTLNCSHPSWLPAASALQHQRAVSEYLRPSRGSSYSMHSDLLGQSPYLQEGLPEFSLHQIPALGRPRRDQSQLHLVKEPKQLHNPQPPKLKAVLSHSSSGEASGPHRPRCRPFRVRFADETLRDTAIRYWERYCAGFLSVQPHDVLGPEARDFHRAPAPPVFRNSADMEDYWSPRPAVGRESRNSFIEQLLHTRLCGQEGRRSSLREPVLW